MASYIKLLVVGIHLIFSINLSYASTWWNSNWNYRVSLSVNSGNYQRFNRPAEVAINFTSYFSSDDVSTAFDLNSIRVLEANSKGQIITENIPFQFDPAKGYNAISNANGTLIFLLNNNTPVQSERYFQVYFDVAGGKYKSPTFTSQVNVTDNVFDEGQNSFLISTDVADYNYQKIAGGFSSIVDNNGNDWLNYHPTGGAAGNYRGIPNLVPPWDGGHFHPGSATSTTTLVHQGPLKATIRSKTKDGLWEVQWEFFPQFARMSVLLAEKNFWFLYEGTPGGLLDANDFVVRSNGAEIPYTSSWNGDLPIHEWVYFSDSQVGRSIFLAHHENDTAVDSYRQKNNKMTVFGFGRNGSQSLIQPQAHHFTIGLIDSTDFASTSTALLSAYKDINVTISSIDQNTITHILPNNKWHQISLPYDPGVYNTVNNVFGDDGLGTYGTDWVIYSFDAISNVYVKPALTDALRQGVGYWMIQLTGSDKTLDMLQGSTPTVSHMACPIGRCFEIPLDTRAGTIQWNMIGYPFSSKELFNRTRIGTKTPICNSGCTIDDAQANDIFHNQLWSYDGFVYKLIDTSNGNLDPWLGYWAGILNNADGKEPSLLIPY